MGRNELIVDLSYLASRCGRRHPPCLPRASIRGLRLTIYQSLEGAKKSLVLSGGRHEILLEPLRRCDTPASCGFWIRLPVDVRWPPACKQDE